MVPIHIFQSTKVFCLQICLLHYVSIIRLCDKNLFSYKTESLSRRIRSDSMCLSLFIEMLFLQISVVTAVSERYSSVYCLEEV